MEEIAHADLALSKNASLFAAPSPRNTSNYGFVPIHMKTKKLHAKKRQNCPISGALAPRGKPQISVRHYVT
jgi:hypothetical protein